MTMRPACTMRLLNNGFTRDETEEADALLRRLAFDDGMELWVAESQGQIIDDWSRFVGGTAGGAEGVSSRSAWTQR